MICSSQESRDALQLHLKGSIIVVDEAHNLVDAVNGAHTAQLSLHQLTAAAAQLSSYLQRFRTRLAAGLTLPCYVCCCCCCSYCCGCCCCYSMISECCGWPLLFTNQHNLAPLRSICRSLWVMDLDLHHKPRWLLCSRSNDAVG